MAEKTKWKFGRKLKVFYQKPSAMRENMVGFGLDGFFSANVDEMVERPVYDRRPAKPDRCPARQNRFEIVGRD